MSGSFFGMECTTTTTTNTKKYLRIYLITTATHFSWSLCTYSGRLGTCSEWQWWHM